MRILIYPGTFDPFTNGHLDIVRRAARLCDRLLVAVLTNNMKKPAFTVEERLEMLRQSIAAESLANVEILTDDGLLVNLYRRVGADAVIRGLRGETDFHFESELAAANRCLLPEYETLLLPCRPELVFLSSSVVREVAYYGGDFTGMVPAAVQPYLRRRYPKANLQRNESQEEIRA